jgi:UMP-CMP kinase
MQRAESSGRTDDNVETLRRRFNQYKTEQMDIINKYEEMGKVKTINGLQEVESVFGDVKTALTGYI